MTAEEKKFEPKAPIGPLQTPFEHIALAFSGGGFRAASYGLGVLSYLNEMPLREGDPTTLLQKVTYMSSASGGTIATSVYTLHSVQGKSFSDFYKHLFENLEGTGMVEEALQILNDKKAWKERPEKTRNIINCFALAYDKLLYQHASVEALKENPGNTHIEEVCFNSTDLYRGLLFRQTVQTKPDKGPNGRDETFLYGNFIVNLDHQAADRLQISDLLAASSCFPAGFEPIVFPKDFVNTNASRNFLMHHLNIQPQELSWTELNVLYNKQHVERVYNSLPRPVNVEEFAEALESLELKKDLDICLMDGGITDNQGLESLMQANDRRIKDKSSFQPFDLMMICDVGSHYMDAYQLPKLGKTSWFSINRVRWMCIILFILGVAGTGLIWKCCLPNLWWNILSVVTSIIALGSLTIVLLLQWLKRFIGGQVDSGAGLNLQKNFSKEIVLLLFRHFRSIRFNLLSFMLTERATSVLTLNNDVFLKRIRYLLYNQFFDQHNLKATGRAKANHIYDLTFTNDDNRLLHYSHKYVPSTNMQVVAEAAFDMATTLWFSKEDEDNNIQAAIIACGQFTTCFNLLDYIEKLKKSHDGRPSIFGQLSPENQQLVNSLESRLNVHFEEFKKDPFWLYNQLGKASGIRNFKPVAASSFPYPEAFKGLR